MCPYRCYFFDRQGHITAMEILDCVGDEEARRLALDLQRERGCFAAEVWDGGRRVLRSGTPCAAGTPAGD